MSLVMPDPTPPSGKDELREKLIDMYMKIACGFYFEGSDETTEKLEYAPKFADEIMQLIAASNHQAVQKAVDNVLDDIRNIIANEKQQWLGDQPALEALGYVDEGIAVLAAAQPRKDGDAK